jgi:DNA mismatch endonuclease (patch repair protein)
MADVFSKKKRSEVMSLIKGKDTQPERAVRSILHRLGYRFRLNRVDLPGKPDIVLATYRAVILVHGCFWHRHSGCHFAYTPKSRKEFWNKKFEKNVVRDKIVKKELNKLGWHLIVAWECELRSPVRLANRLHLSLSRRRLKLETLK